jgi:hypothetical protein
MHEPREAGDIQAAGTVYIYTSCKDPLLIGDKTHAQIALTPSRDKTLTEEGLSIDRNVWHINVSLIGVKAI